MVGQTIGKYRILDRIGRGSMGTVYRAEDKSLHRDVAIKILNADLNDPAAGRRFRAEAIAVARLNHPGIAKVYDLFEHDSQWLMAMEFVSGETLESLVTRRGPLPADQAADLVSQALLALAHAHGMGVVHRDLKPANLMVSDGRLKITDFGIARVAGMEHLTSAGLRMGTPAYMAPEQVLGHEIDARTDIFAMGCVTFFLATAALPFKGDTAIELVQARLRDDPTPARTVRHELPVWFGEVVACALARDPANRFQTANDFHLAIERGLAGLPVDVGPRTGAVPLHLMETVIPGTMRSGPAGPSVPAGPSTAATRAPARKSRTGLVIGGAVVAIAAIVAAAIWLRPAPISPTAAPAAEVTPQPTAAPTPTQPPSPATPPAVSGSPVTTSLPVATSTPAPGMTTAVTSTPGAVSPIGRRGGATEAPISFNTVKLLKVAGRKGDDVDATLTIGGVSIVVAPRRAGTPVDKPFKSLTSATYVKGREPKWAANLAGPPAGLDLPGGKLGLGRPARHWLVLQGSDWYFVLILSDADVEQILKTLTDRTHVKIDRPTGK